LLAKLPLINSGDLQGKIQNVSSDISNVAVQISHSDWRD